MRVLVLSLLASAPLAIAAQPPRDTRAVLEEVIVTATLREQRLVEVPAGVTVLSAQTLRDAGRQHFEDVLRSVPNLHWAGGTSRPRYFQIRGIGERDQYDGAPNASVGFLIDDIDFSGIGMPAALFDMERVEVLRGPQGLRYGANALAGLIVMRSADPGSETAFRTEASLAEYGSRSIGAVATAPVESLDSSWRFAVQQHRSDGYRSSAIFADDDTEERDELVGRFKWRWQPSEATRIDLTWLHSKIDNGYDGWSIDNTRRSLADRPGRDAQDADGAALRVETQAGAAARLTVIATALKADSEYSFDGDWGNAQSWAPYTYDFFYRALRERRTRSLEARLESVDAPSAPGEVAWLAGIYALDLDERLHEMSVGDYIDPFMPEFSGSVDDELRAKYDARNIAFFAQLDGLITERSGWSFGVRGEERDADYRDGGVDGGELRTTIEGERDRMVGGQATLHFDPRENMRLFATVARGYKAGGFNLGQGAAIRPAFEAEYLWSIDAGLKGEWLDRRLYADVTAFYMKRRDMQVTTGIQLDPIGDPNSYLFYTDNAAGGRNLGIEASLRWRASAALELGASLSVLRTRYSGYAPAGEDLSDRDQAHAPEYQAALNATWRHPFGWMARVDALLVDDYYFDVPPNPSRAGAYALAHLKAGYEADRWSVYLWGRNVLDEDYAVRGFFFGNEPPAFESKRYVQLGEPRLFGLTATWEF